MELFSNRAGGLWGQGPHLNRGLAAQEPEPVFKTPISNPKSARGFENNSPQPTS